MTLLQFSASVFKVNSMAKLFNSHLLRTSLTKAIQKGYFNRPFHLSVLNMIKVGESIPSAELFEGNPGCTVNIAELCKDKKVILFGVPGAFTPGCSRTHLPGFVDRYAELKKKGIDEIVCVSVNDAFVMDAWGKDQDATGKVRMLADATANFTKLIGLDIELPKLGGVRSKRYSMIIDKGVVTFLNVEPDGTGLSCSLANKLPI